MFPTALVWEISLSTMLIIENTPGVIYALTQKIGGTCMPKSISMQNTHQSSQYICTPYSSIIRHVGLV
jgi:hypothetical protein